MLTAAMCLTSDLFWVTIRTPELPISGDIRVVKSLWLWFLTLTRNETDHSVVLVLLLCYCKSVVSHSCTLVCLVS